MTNEKAISIIKNAFSWYEDNARESEDEDWSGQHEALDLAIQALEQQPFINKPCVSEGVCREDKIQVLDKMKAEIEDLTYYSWEVGPRTVIDDVLEIIDKYKIESEDTEC